MKNKPFFAVIYMFAVTAFFSTILIGFAKLTRGRVEANQQIAFEKAVLQVFPEIEAATNTEIHRVFTEQFEPASKGFVYRKDGQIAGYAVPVAGQGFWAPIRGIVGVASDKKTITGIAFYEQTETPGLGARIVEPEFCNAFIGKQLSDDGKLVGIRPEGTAINKSEVHAITGATQTCTRLEKLLNDGLTQWQQEGAD
jgi:RnfABCDGE-type electron transport complex G subunit